jgi:hypothetical protein
VISLSLDEEVDKDAVVELGEEEEEEPAQGEEEEAAEGRRRRRQGQGKCCRPTLSEALLAMSCRITLNWKLCGSTASSVSLLEVFSTCGSRGACRLLLFFANAAILL